MRDFSFEPAARDCVILVAGDTALISCTNGEEASVSMRTVAAVAQIHAGLVAEPNAKSFSHPAGEVNIFEPQSSSLREG